MNIVRGRLTKWAKEKGYLHKTQTEVNESGRKYFKVYILSTLEGFTPQLHTYCKIG